MKSAAPLLLLMTCAMLGAASTARAQNGAAPATNGRVFRVDDSATVVLDPFLEMQARVPGRGSSASPLVSARTRVSVQLNLAPWVGRSGRIYMSLPRTSGPTVRAIWSTGGTLLPGSLLSGDRTVVYAGPLPEPLLRDLIDIKLEADGARLIRPEALAFGFEIEIDP